MSKELTRVQRIVAALNEVADALQVHPSAVTKAQLLKNTGIKVSSRDIDMCPGGLGSIKRAHFPIVGKELVAAREMKDTSKYIRDLENKIAERGLFEEQALKAIDNAITKLKLSKVKLPKPKVDKKKKLMTMELMISDIHYGKLTPEFNLNICRERMRRLTNTFLDEYKKQSKLFNVEKFIIAILGDIIESFTMHGLESASGCEFGNSRQVDESIESLFFDVILPIAETGVTIEIPTVTGNHDRTSTNRTYQSPGENNLTWIIYNTLERLSKASGLTNVKFYIPKGSYVILNIYGNNALYEHGDNAKANTKAAFEALMDKRAKQEDKVLHFGRFGHWHEGSIFDRGRIIVNESVCGPDSYSQVMGFKSSPGQTINYYIKTSSRPTCFYHSFPVYLG